jgi:hypothetical protein
VDKVEAGGAGKALGLVSLDVVSQLSGVAADELEKWGAKSSKLAKHLAERPLEVVVARGLPLHQLLLPARADSNPDTEKKLKQRILKVSIRGAESEGGSQRRKEWGSSGVF